MKPYLERTTEYWQKDYQADNVESFIFRLYGRVLAQELTMKGDRGERLLDFGCGQGAAIRYFASKGFSVFGVDVNASAIEYCKHRMPEAADHFKVIHPPPKMTTRGLRGPSILLSRCRRSITSVTPI